MIYPYYVIQIDDAPYEDMEIRPCENPVLRYSSDEFFNPERLEEIVDEIEDKCFQLIMNSSGQVYSYLECFMEMNREKKIKLQRDVANTLAYQIEYIDNVKDRYDSGIRRHYIQCFGRNPKRTILNDFVQM